MSYNVEGNNMLQWFYPISQPHNNPNKASTTNYKINNTDISNNYVGIGTNSNIPVSQLYNINYFKNGINIGDLFELNLPVFTGTIGTDFKIWPVTSDTTKGTVIQILTSQTLRFNYNVNCSFSMIGGGGSGGGSNASNAGGGGGAGQLIIGKINNLMSGNPLTITIGDGANYIESAGGDTKIKYSTTTITAKGGGKGGSGKGGSLNTTGSSSGGSGSWSNASPTVGTVTPGTTASTGIFSSMKSYNNMGALGNHQNNDSGGGGGGGGAGGNAPSTDNNNPGTGGDGYLLVYETLHFTLGGGGGGGGREDKTGPSPQGVGGAGGDGGGGDGGGPSGTNDGNGNNGFDNTGGGGGGASNSGGYGGYGGSGTVIFYIQASGVSI